MCVCILFQARALGQITYDQLGRLETGYARFKNAHAVTNTHTQNTLTHSLTQSLISVFDAPGGFSYFVSKIKEQRNKQPLHSERIHKNTCTKVKSAHTFF